jgi:glycerol-3-phosphate cytidylyltransferase
MKTKTVLTYGTFDMFHIGHLKLLQRAQEMGDRLIVAVSTDAFNREKGKKPLSPMNNGPKSSPISRESIW